MALILGTITALMLQYDPSRWIFMFVKSQSKINRRVKISAQMTLLDSFD